MRDGGAPLWVERSGKGQRGRRETFTSPDREEETDAGSRVTDRAVVYGSQTPVLWDR